MDLATAVDAFERALANQVALGGPDTEATAEALLNAVRPAIEQVALDLAQQAAAEASAQLPDADVEVALRDGEPEIVVRPHDPVEASFRPDDMEARLTLRLPAALKEAVEAAADDAASSVNAYVVKSLSASSTRRAGRGKRFKGTVST